MEVLSIRKCDKTDTILFSMPIFLYEKWSTLICSSIWLQWWTRKRGVMRHYQEPARFPRIKHSKLKRHLSPSRGRDSGPTPKPKTPKSKKRYQEPDTKSVKSSSTLNLPAIDIKGWLATRSRHKLFLFCFVNIHWLTWRTNKLPDHRFWRGYCSLLFLQATTLS